MKIPDRYRYLVLIHRDTGEKVVVELHYRRLKKLQNNIFAWSGVVERYYPDALMIMVDLTYKKVDDWKPGHIRSYVKTLKGSMGASLITWAWVMELQKRGAVHYHMLLVTDGKWCKLPDRSGQWKWGMSKVGKARSVYYLADYVGKEHQKDFTKFPKDARSYGVGFRDKQAREAFREFRGLLKISSGGEKGVWQYFGSALQKSYLEKVLLKDKM